MVFLGNTFLVSWFQRLHTTFDHSKQQTSLAAGIQQWLSEELCSTYFYAPFELKCVAFASSAQPQMHSCMFPVNVLFHLSKKQVLQFFCTIWSTRPWAKVVLELRVQWLEPQTPYLFMRWSLGPLSDPSRKEWDAVKVTHGFPVVEFRNLFCGAMKKQTNVHPQPCVSFYNHNPKPLSILLPERKAWIFLCIC